MLLSLRSTAVALAAAVWFSRCAGGAATELVPIESPSPSASPSPDRSAFIAAVDALAAEALRRGPIAGLSIAVFEHGQPIVAAGYGFADVAAGVAATADTSYPIASVTKHFTAAAVLRLADQGHLGLDDPLSRFFPAARPKIGALTVRHLLDHTSGLTRNGPAPRHAALSVIARGGTARAQGEDWDYSNYNFSLLGLVIEKASGRDYAHYVRDEIAAPLALKGTGYCEDGSEVSGRGRDYQSGAKTVSPTAYWMDPRFFAAGGLCSTVLDLVRFEKGLEEGRVVSPALLKAMRAPARLPDGLEADYGYGTRLGFTGRHRKLGHTGAGQSSKAVLARYPDDDVTVAVLLNTERNNATVTAASSSCSSLRPTRRREAARSRTRPCPVTPGSTVTARVSCVSRRRTARSRRILDWAIGPARGSRPRAGTCFSMRRSRPSSCALTCKTSRRAGTAATTTAGSWDWACARALARAEVTIDAAP